MWPIFAGVISLRNTSKPSNRPGMEQRKRFPRLEWPGNDTNLSMMMGWDYSWSFSNPLICVGIVESCPLATLSELGRLHKAA